ncbi:MAG: cytochrome c3 family protein [Caldilineales bacterium]
MIRQTSHNHRIFSAVIMALAWLLLLSNSALAQQTPPTGSLPPASSVDNATCLNCHQQAGLMMTLPSGEVMAVTVDNTVLAHSMHAEESCQDCHSDISSYPHGTIPVNSYRELQIYYSQSCADCHDEQAMEQVESVHAQLQAGGVQEAAVCADCHGAHNTQAIDREKHPELPLTATAQICQQCHSGIYNQFEQSVHGKALTADANSDVPTCTTCHPAHSADDPRTQAFRLTSPELCATCHADKTLMAQYEISTQVFDTYVADFHGATVMLFEKTHPDQATNKAVCTDCHGVHNITPATRDNQQIKDNILPRCRECHPDATDNFANSWLGHYAPNFETAPMVTAITWFYRILIPALVAFFLIYIALDYYRHRMDARHNRKEVQA